MISKVYFIGSRVKGTHRPDSDLDVAIQFGDSYGYRDWFFEAENWRNELDRLVSTRVHLLRGGGGLRNANVQKAVQELGMLVFERPAGIK